MKLLIVASLSNIATANYFITALREAGYELLVCSDIDALGVHIRAKGLIDVEALLCKHRFEADAALFFEGGSMRLLPDTSGVKTCPTLWYAIDTHMDFEKHVRIGRLFDMTLVAQRQYVAPLMARGLTQVQWLPLAFAPALLPGTPPERNIDIAYVGSDDATVHPHRSLLLNALRGRFPSHRFGRATPEEMGRIYAAARVVFNRSVNNDLNMRFFEAMGAGAVLVTDRVVDNGVETLFEEGRHYICYENEEDLLRKVSDVLQDPARLREIGTAAQSLVLSLHTYVHRASDIATHIARARIVAKPSPGDVFVACLALGLTADALRAAARATEQVGGGRFQALLGRGAALWIRLAATFVAAIDGLRRALSPAR
jgi:glycosyltransferase involved in cell wall biosynthesis